MFCFFLVCVSFSVMFSQNIIRHINIFKKINYPLNTLRPYYIRSPYDWCQHLSRFSNSTLPFVTATLQPIRHTYTRNMTNQPTLNVSHKNIFRCLLTFASNFKCSKPNKKKKTYKRLWVVSLEYYAEYSFIHRISFIIFWTATHTNKIKNGEQTQKSTHS